MNGCCIYIMHDNFSLCNAACVQIRFVLVELSINWLLASCTCMMHMCVLPLYHRSHASATRIS